MARCCTGSGRGWLVSALLVHAWFRFVSLTLSFLLLLTPICPPSLARLHRSGNLESPESLATAVDQVPYVGPLAAPGGGHHRLVLALYRQEGKADFTSVTGGDVATLAGRYIDNADMIAALRLQPKGLCFFQSCHDDSVEARFAALGRGMPQF